MSLFSGWTERDHQLIFTAYGRDSRYTGREPILSGGILDEACPSSSRCRIERSRKVRIWISRRQRRGQDNADPSYHRSTASYGGQRASFGLGGFFARGANEAWLS